MFLLLKPNDQLFHSPASSMWFLLLVSTLHTLNVARSGKLWQAFAVVKNNLLLNLNTLWKSPIAFKNAYKTDICWVVSFESNLRIFTQSAWWPSGYNFRASASRYRSGGRGKCYLYCLLVRRSAFKNGEGLGSWKRVYIATSGPRGGGGAPPLLKVIGTCRWTGYDFADHEYWHRVWSNRPNVVITIDTGYQNRPSWLWRTTSFIIIGSHTHSREFSIAVNVPLVN